MRSSHLRKMIQVRSGVVTRKHAGTVTSPHIRLVIAISHSAKSGARRRAAVLACVSVTRTPDEMVYICEGFSSIGKNSHGEPNTGSITGSCGASPLDDGGLPLHRYGLGGGCRWRA